MHVLNDSDEKIAIRRGVQAAKQSCSDENAWVMLGCKQAGLYHS